MNVRIRRYAEATNYAKVLTGVYNGIPKGENGMIIKYQEPAQPIKYMGGYDKRGNMVLPVTNENGMNNVTLPEVTVTPRNINLAGAVDRGRREAAKQGKLRVKSPKPGTLDIQGYPIRNPQTLTHPDIMKNPSYDYIDIDILADFPPNSVGHEFKHAIENYQAALTKGLYTNEARTDTFMLIGNNMKSVSTDGGHNWTTSTLGEYTLTDLIYVDSNWYAIGLNGTKRFLLRNTASTFDQSNKILDLPDYSRQVIKINT